MAEYRSSILRNAILAAIGISLIVGVAIFGSTVITQNFPPAPSNSGPYHVNTSHSSITITNLSSSATSSTGGTSISSASSSASTSATSSTTSSPTTQYTPQGTIATIQFSASGFSFDNDTGIVYIFGTSSSSNIILEINASTNQVMAQIVLPQHESAASGVFDPANKLLYFSTNMNSLSPHSSIIALNTTSNSLAANITTTSFATLALDPIHNILFASYVTTNSSTTFVNASEISGASNTVTKNITLFSQPSTFGGCCYIGDVSYNYGNGLLYASLGTNGVDGGFGPFDVIFNTTSNQLISGFTLKTYGTSSFAQDPSKGIVYVANNGAESADGAYNPPFITAGDNVTVGTGANYTYSIQVENENNPNGTMGSIFYSSTSQRLFVANGTLANNSYQFVDQNVTIINTLNDQVSQVIGVQSGVTALFFDSSNGDLYVASASTIYVIALH